MRGNVRLTAGSFLSVCGCLTAILLGAGVDLGARAELPEGLLGAWTTDCRTGLPSRLEFRNDGAGSMRASGRVACRTAGLRALGTSRWYADFDCDDGSLVELDLNLVGPHTLLAAPRPLGTACTYRSGRP
jgi:hypothetical protein